jgi:hypothetical protein
MFYDDEEIGNQESEILEAAYFKPGRLNNPQAIRHVKEGLIRRLYMMKSSRIFMRENTNPDRGKPLSVYLATDLAIHVNSYYLNLCGSLDNMAWALAYEWDMLPNIDEGNLDSRRYCNLFGNRFLQDVQQRRSELANFLRGHIQWNRDLRDFRDPAAHRIPLYVPPAVLLGEEALEKFNEIGKEAEKSEKERGGRSLSEIFDEQRSVAKYVPLIITSPIDGLEPHSIPDQVGADHQRFLNVTEAVLNAL